MKKSIRAFVQETCLTCRYCEDIADVVYDRVKPEVMYIIAMLWIGGIFAITSFLNNALCIIGCVLITILAFAVYFGIAACSDRMEDIR